MFRPDIQGLRMLAVVAVIADHLFAWPAGGFVGVDVFFVISGFLITGLLLREHEKTGRISFVGFYRRRLKRILPAATMVVFASVVAAFFIFNRIRFDQTLWDGVWATVFASNWHFAAAGTDYFQADGPVSPLQHFWSLSVEEQFYFVWPWLMLLIFALVTRRAGRSTIAARRTVGVAIVVITMCSFAWSLYETRTSPTLAYFSTFSRVWELGIGAAVAVFAGAFAGIPNAVRPVLGWIGLAGILVSLFVVSADFAFPAPWAALPVASTALTIVAGTGGPQRFLWPLMNPVSTYLGNISYSLYLWHFPLIIFIGEFMAGDTAVFWATTLAAIAALSVLSYHLVEDPLRRSAWLEPKTGGRSRRRPPARRRLGESSPLALSVLGVVIAGATVLVIAAFSVPVPAPTPALAAMPPSAAPSASTTPAAPETFAATLQTQIKQALTATAWPELSPGIDDLATLSFDPVDANGCAPSNPQGKDCSSITVADPAKTAVVVGNSIAVAWLPGIRAALEPQGWTVVSLAMIGCPFVDAETVNPDEGVTGACPGHKEEVVETINRLHPALVISSNVYGTEFASSAGYATATDHWAAALDSQFAKIEGSVGTIVMLSQPPRGTDPQSCASRVSSPRDCVFSPPAEWASFATAEKRVGDAPQRTFVNTLTWFCTNARCPAFVGTTPVKRDSTHITPQYAELVAPLLSDAILGVPTS
ncbi:hypothetical protein B7R21_06865 [Subtercola boreus]|uniref:Acyltransferase n=1 Tax=Subtercola boreus TaxID=120213 RepID=A0A3E0VXU5_9MICO|nr:acyltransferase family protein [Subtercola boreus]RFA14299.1 hypothetical protein B7R21_06865 [Subtercola boreus]